MGGEQHRPAPQGRRRRVANRESVAAGRHLDAALKRQGDLNVLTDPALAAAIDGRRTWAIGTSLPDRRVVAIASTLRSGPAVEHPACEALGLTVEDWANGMGIKLGLTVPGPLIRSRRRTSASACSGNSSSSRRRMKDAIRRWERTRS